MFDNYRQLPAHAAPLAAVIDECLTGRRAIVRRALKLSGAQSAASHLGVTVSPLFDEARRTARRDLPVHGSDGGHRPRRSGAPEGQPGAGRRADRRHRARVQKRPGDDSRLQPVDRPRRRCRRPYRPYVEGIRAETTSLGRGRHQFPQLREARRSSPLRRSICRPSRERTADDLRPEAAARGGDIIVSGTFAIVDGDDVLLRQAFSNLLRNAHRSVRRAPACRRRCSVDAAIDPTRSASAASASTTTGRASSRRPRSHLPSVLHDESHRHGPRSRARAEDHRHAQRPRDDRDVAARRREPAAHAAAAPRLIRGAHFSRSSSPRAWLQLPRVRSCPRSMRDFRPISRVVPLGIRRAHVSACALSWCVVHRRFFAVRGRGRDGDSGDGDRVAGGTVRDRHRGESPRARHDVRDRARLSEAGTAARPRLRR